MKKIALLLIVALVGLGVTESGYAQQGNRGGRRGGMGPAQDQFRRMAFQELNLTAEQESQLLKIHQKHRSDVARLMAEMVSARTDLRTALTADTLDDKAIDQSVGRIAELEKKQLKLRVDFVKSLRQILNADQIRKLNLESAFGRGMGGGMGRGGFGGSMSEGF